jgi:hypothetical protein
MGQSALPLDDLPKHGNTARSVVDREECIELRVRGYIFTPLRHREG